MAAESTFESNPTRIIANDKKNEVCQDFIRGVCFRSTCKFLHVHDTTVQKRYVFCRDFQKGRCTRMDCRFIHCSVRDEEHYKTAGELLPHVQAAFLRAKLGISSKITVSNTPVCKDFIKGICKRSSCKYRHSDPIVDNDSYEPSVKRRRRENNDSSSRLLRELRYENATLRTRYDELSTRASELLKRLHSLQKTNDYLLEQNAVLRSREKKLTGRNYKNETPRMPLDVGLLYP